MRVGSFGRHLICFSGSVLIFHIKGRLKKQTAFRVALRE
ncbi:hypothetical protein l13_18130 [Neisseria weaveri ATCC 51223]|nr:hypothetical protein l13_18130 [Neisseria weaveri ATCC 51223]